MTGGKFAVGGVPSFASAASSPVEPSASEGRADRAAERGPHSRIALARVLRESLERPTS
jgi:hypothetical protein